MWSNFFMQEEDRRRREAASRRRAQGQHQLTPEREGKIKLGLLLSAVGATLAVLAVGTEFWVELNTYKTNGSAICEAAHMGLWKMCTKRLWQSDVPAGRDTCGPAELPGGEKPHPQPEDCTPRERERWGSAEPIPQGDPEPQEGNLQFQNQPMPTSASAPWYNLCPRRKLYWGWGGRVGGKGERRGREERLYFRLACNWPSCTHPPQAACPSYIPCPKLPVPSD